MNVNSSSIFADIPSRLAEELCQTLLTKPTVHIERIISTGQSSPTNFWYDQPQDEWVLVLQGRARLAFEHQPDLELGCGDYLLIPAHCRHRVAWTDAEIPTVWLAVHVFTEDKSAPV